MSFATNKTYLIERFERHGFRAISLRLVDAIIPSLQNFRKYLEHPDFVDLPGVAKLQWFNRWTRSNRLAKAAHEVGMGMFHRTIEQWLGDPKRAQFMLVSMVKTVTG
jgi:hypothetical protein